MDSLIYLAIALVVSIPLAVIYLLISNAGLRTRLRELEVLVAGHSRAIPVTRDPPRPPEARPSPAPETVPIPKTPPPPESDPWRRPDGESPVHQPIAASVSAPAAVAEGPKSGPIVLNPERAQALAGWLKVNWVYAVSALSLALAGIFLVQYGMEKGLLPPAARVLMGICFGLALIGAGEWLRRRHGDGEDVSTAYLPSTFSGAGIVSMFAAIIAARQLYGLVGLEVGFTGLVAVAALAIVLGWFHGPFLAAIGLLGAAAAPSAVGGGTHAPDWLYAYYGLITLAGLAVDAVRRWAWVSVLALVIGFGTGWLMLQSGAAAGGFAMLAVALVLIAIAVPVLQIAPSHGGPIIAQAMWERGRDGWPEFPARLAGGAMLTAVLGLLFQRTSNATEDMLVYVCLAILMLAVTLWARNARALADLAILPAAAFLARLALEGVGGGHLLYDFADQAITLRPPETSAPMTVTWLLGLATLMTLAAAWRSFRGVHPAFWAAGAALIAPIAAVLIELFWNPEPVIGTYPWALQAIGLAALMVVLAERFARRDADDHRRAAYATLSALSLIAFAFFIILTQGALTLALAVLLVAAAALDRRFRLPEMTLFLQAGVLTLAFRLIVDPGLDWATDHETPRWEIVASFGGAIAGMGAALWLLRGMGRRQALVFLESGLFGSAALFANVLITRWIDTGHVPSDLFSHWALSLNAMPWLIVALVQLYRLQLGGVMRFVRIALAGIAGLLALGGLWGSVMMTSPLIYSGSPVRGSLALDTLFVAYALPAILLVLALPRLRHLPRALWLSLLGLGAGLAALYVGLEIRRFWRGDDLSVPGVTQPELYSYTVALLLLGAGLLCQAIARRSSLLRLIAMGVIAVTVAKVFLIDASGLSGLTRVFSFLALGLSLAGLAWLNRWAAGRQGEPGQGSDRGPDQGNA